MARRKDLHVLFPLAGLNRRGAYRQQAPYSSTDLMNVRAMATLEGRERGGSRPGLVKSHITDIGSDVRLLSPMILALGDNFTAYSDTFGGTELAAAWAQASWASDVPSILPTSLASVDTSTAEGEVVRDALSIDSSQTYVVEALIVPYNGEFHGDYRIYLRLHDDTPAIGTEGVVVELVMTGSTGSWSGTITSWLASSDSEIDFDTGSLSPASAKPVWLSVIVSNTDDIDVYWDGTKILSGTAGAQTGLRVGFGMECTVAGGLCLVDTFRVQYYSTSTIDGSRTMLFASAGGNIFTERTHGTLTQTTTTQTVRDDTPLTAAQSGQKLYIADYGDLRDTGTDGQVTGAVLDDVAGQGWTALGIDPQDDVCVISNVAGGTVAGTYKISSVHDTNGVTLASSPGNGTCAYRIERAPKVYDPAVGVDTLTIHTASTGQVPTGCPLVVNYLDRLVLAGADIAPHVWYMSRKGDPDDWDYSQSDSQAAAAGTASDAGMPGTAITALAVHNDDYLIIGCHNSLWRMRGDPAYGGTLDVISQVVGIFGANSWCLGPTGELIFLSTDGLYALAPGGDSAPLPLSRSVLPDEFKNIDPLTTTVSLEYDPVDQGVHIFLTPDFSNQRVHWWFDWERKTFWPFMLEADHEPLATCRFQSTAVEDSAIVLGCRDGLLRRFSGLATSDCGTAFTSYAMIGPIALAQDGMLGSIVAMQGVMAADSADVTWSTHPSSTFEGTVTASAISTGTWSGGLNASNYKVGRGQACMLKITESSGLGWAMESVLVTIDSSGKRRLP